MRKRLKKILLVSGGIFLFLVLILAVISLLFYFNKNLGRNVLQKYLAQKMGVRAEIGKLDYGLFPLTIRADSVEIFYKTDQMGVDIFLEKLSVRGDVKKVLKKQKPALDIVEIEGVQVQIRQREVRKNIDLQKIIAQVFDSWGYSQRITIKDGSLDLVFAPQNFLLTLDGVSLFLSPSAAKRTCDFVLSSKKMGIRLDRRDISLESGLDSAGTLSYGDRVFLEGRISLEPLYAVLSGRTADLETLALQIKGEFDAREKKVFVPQFELEMKNLARASGNLTAVLASDLSFRLTSDISVDHLENALIFMRPYLPQDFQDIAVRGKATAAGEYRYTGNSQGQKDEIEGSLALEKTHLMYSAAGLSFQTDLSGRFSIQGPLSNPQISGLLKSRNGSLSRKNIEIRNLRLDFPLRGSADRVHFPSFNGALGNLSFSSTGRTRAFENVEFEGKGNADLLQRILTLDILEARIAGLASFQSRARFIFNPGGEKFLSLRSSGLELGRLRRAFSSDFPKELEGWEFEGICGLDFELRNLPRTQNEWQISGKLDLAKANFHDAGFSYAGERFQTILDLKGTYRLSQKAFLFSGAFELPQGESLWKNFYFNWGKYPVSGKLAGSIFFPLRQLNGLQGNVIASSLGEIQIRGSANLKQPFLLDFEAEAKINLDSLDSLFSRHQSSSQSRMNLKGQAETRARLNMAKDSLSVRGELLLKSASIENRAAGIFILGMEAGLPIHFEKGTKEIIHEEAPSSSKGYFRVAELRTPFLVISLPELTLLSGKNRFQVEPFSLDLFGGKAEFGNIFFSLDSATWGLKGSFSLELNKMDVSRFPLTSQQFRLSGTARAEFPLVDIDPHKITTRGKAEIDIFGGKVTVQNISVLNPFSKGRTISTDVIFQNINLEKLTDSVPFGRVTGIIKGEIKDLAFSFGQPEGFVLHLESVKKKGVPQKFSLRAVNDLAVISSGEATSLKAAKGWMRFVSSFRYEKIGISSSLKNDMFTLRGTIFEDGEEYLVKKSSLFGISVINRMPEKQVSFKEMTQRLKRIGKSNPKLIER